MTKHKHRWTRKEEEALYDGVKEYGTGKWKEILKDRRFSAILVDRSNVDLKVLIFLLYLCKFFLIVNFWIF